MFRLLFSSSLTVRPSFPQFATSLVKKYIVSIQLDYDANLNFGAGHHRTGLENDRGEQSCASGVCEYISDEGLGVDLERGAQELRVLLDEVNPSLKLYSNLREKRFASIDVLSKNVKGKYRQALSSVVRDQLSIDVAGPSQADSATAEAEPEAESEDEDDPVDSNDPDDPEIDVSRAAQAGGRQTLSATARNTLRLQAAAAALCDSSGDDEDDDDESANDQLGKILRECQFACAQINAFIRDQNPSRLLRFCDQEVLGAYDAPGAATFAIRDVVAVAFLGSSKWFVDFGLIHELTYASSRGTAHHGRAITAARSTVGTMAQLQFYTRQLATMGQRFRLIGDGKFALDERGRDVLSFTL